MLRPYENLICEYIINNPIKWDFDRENLKIGE